VTDRAAQLFIPCFRLERSVLLELLQAFSLAVVSLTLMMLVMAAYRPVQEGLPLGAVITVLPMMIPYALPWTIPTAFVAACIMVYSRMAANNELTAVRASGIHLWRVLAPAAATGLVLCVVCALLNHELVPRARFRQYSVVKNASASEQVAALRALAEPVMEVGGYRVYVSEMTADDTLRDLVIVLPEKLIRLPGTERRQRQLTFIRAPLGHYEYSDERSQIVFHLEGDPTRNTADDPYAGKASMYKIVYGTSPLDFEYAVFASCVVPVKLKSMEDLDFLPHKAKHMTSGRLITRAQRRESELRSGRMPFGNLTRMSPARRKHAEKKLNRWRQEPLHWRTEVHKRAALALSPLLLAAIAVPVGVMMRQRWRLVAFGLAVVIMLGYYALMAGAWKLGMSGTMPPAVSVWGATVMIAAVGFERTRNLLRW
jgi:lipopolysaccharide export system permease protein